MVDADPYRVQQVALNLLTNAVKFTPAGGRIDVVLRARPRTASALLVRDTGQGIAPDLLPHMFDRFRQGDGSSTRAHGGLGLGLAIVKHIVEAHDGTIAARSDGRGSGRRRSRSILPAAGARRGEAGERSGRAVRSAADDGRLTGVLALVVDDEADSRELLDFALKAGRRRRARRRDVEAGADPARDAPSDRDPDRRADARHGRLRAHRRGQKAAAAN